ncbi:putative sporulation protein YtxC [Paenibacillus senegalensis]|uniref:putative sporulation protein YtxC n=1 Tax=Paenibacillus senegalensis TaxID=1465766 RepID=UPI000289DBD0|nr:putative sporulation protein YtxC [Paenibacillus senegalensis]
MKIMELHLPVMPQNHFAAFIQTLQIELHKLKLTDIIFKLHYQQEDYRVNIHGHTNGESILKREIRKQAGTAVSRVLAEYLVDCEEPNLMRKLIRHSYRADRDELEAIYRYAKELLDGSLQEPDLPPPRQKRKAKVAAYISSYLEEESMLIVGGFVDFRMPEYRAELREAVECAIEEIAMEQQYQDFISLLKYYAFVQDTVIPAAHILHKGGQEFQLLNEHMKPLESEFSLDGADEENNGSDEDRIVSTLLSVSPQKIYIHTKEPELQLVKTIQQIFENRVELCTV